MLTRVQVRQLVACPTCGKPVGMCCVDVAGRWASGKAQSPNHRLRVRKAERRAYALRTAHLDR